MSNFICACVEDIFVSYDYNNIPIKYNLLKQHNLKDNAWICFDNDVYSIRKDDSYLLELFKDHYGKNVKDFILNHHIFKNNSKEKILLFEKLKKRKIGILSK
jgi:hypothetical protein